MKTTNLILGLLLIILLSLSYFLLEEEIGIKKEKEENFSVSLNNQISLNKTFSEIKQFVPNMRFAKNNIIFYFEEGCTEEKKERMKKAFKILEEKTGVLSFYENYEGGEIRVICSGERKITENKSFILGEGGPKKFINMTPYALILEGEILLFSKKKEIMCKDPLVELHEILHVFGYDHVNEEDSILYPYLNCNQKLKENIIDSIKEIYSVPAKAEIFLLNVSASKKGRYLNIFSEIKNTGLIEAENISLSIYDKENLIKRYNIGNLIPGTTKILEVKNINLGNRKINELKIFVESKTLEYSKENNFAFLSLNQ